MIKKIPLRAFPELDSIRTISIVLVVIYHQVPSGNFVLNWFKESGWVGVDIFFVLSGFIITKLLLSEHNKYGNINLKKFWFNRAVRLWPGYFLFLAIYFLTIYLWLQKVSETKIAFHNYWWHYVLHFSNYSSIYYGKIHTIMLHFWSLSLEEHFYLLWPIFLVGILKIKWDKKIFFLLLILIPYLMRIYYLQQGLNDSIIHFSTETRFDEMMIGSMLAYYFAYIPKLKLKEEFILSVLMIILFTMGLYIYSSPAISIYLKTLNYTFIGLASALLIVIALNGGDKGLRRILKNETMARLGVLSYGVYLLHPFVHYLVYGLNNKFNLNLHFNLLLVINTVLPFLLACPFFFQIDQRFARLKIHR